MINWKMVLKNNNKNLDQIERLLLKRLPYPQNNGYKDYTTITCFNIYLVLNPILIKWNR